MSPAEPKTLRRARRLLIALTLAAAAAAAAQTPPRDGCSAESGEPTRVAAVEENFDALLDDGRRAALVGLDIPGAGGGREAALARLRAALAADGFLLPAGGLDRWSRLPAQIFVFSQDDGALVARPVAELLLSEGLARFRPDAAAAPCAERLLRAERGARRARLGLWALKEYEIVDSSAFSVNPVAEALVNRKGMMLIEGRVASVKEGRGVVYLDFGPRRGQDFAVAATKRDLANNERFGKFVRSLKGRRVQVRGLLETGYGPRIAISSPLEIEIVDDAATP
jgi:hypothetical protein